VVDVGRLELPTPCLQIKVSRFWLIGISDLHSRCSVEPWLFGPFQGVLRTFSVLESYVSREHVAGGQIYFMACISVCFTIQTEESTFQARFF
jgi:hypothetical protein